MTVLAADRVTPMKENGLKSIPAGTDIFYKGGLVGINPAGYAMMMPAVASAQGYVLAGVCAEYLDNSAGATVDVKVYTRGLYSFDATSITQAMVGQMMYLVDDNTFDDVPGTEAIPVGILMDYVSATSGWIDIDKAVGKNINLLGIVTKTDDYTVLVEESGTVFCCATDGKTFTLPATQKGLVYTFVNTGADGAALLNIDPNAADLIIGNDLIGSDGGILSNTKATAKRGDCVTLVGDGGNGWMIISSIGVWAIA